MTPKLPEVSKVRGLSFPPSSLYRSNLSFGGTDSDYAVGAAPNDGRTRPLLSTRSKSLLYSTSSMSRTIICMAHSSLLGKYGLIIIYALVAILPRLATRCSFCTSTIPFDLSFLHVFVQLSLMRMEGWSIRESAYYFSPAPVLSIVARGITSFLLLVIFEIVVNHQVSGAGWSDIYWIIYLNRTKSCP